MNPIATTAAVFVKAMPSARLEIIDGVGHLPHLEAAERVNRLLRDFLGD